ncbi:endonuclease domain-containing protein [Agrobacterium rosae]|uniref:endonuclease domain-containing protein n=1 Tax=Agrobacterium rosae TaxID=1972867 RepID=UPI003A7FC929
MAHHHQPPPINRNRARTMRKDSTLAENMLWQAIRGGKLEGFKFRRQVPLHNVILDFVCFEAKLIIEVDGSQHAENETDERRDDFLGKHGFRILRFWNDEIERNLDFVCLSILSQLQRGEVADPSPEKSMT